MKQVKLAIVGAGARGTSYADFAHAYPDQVKVVAVAEPRAAYREVMVAKHQIPEANVYDDWQSMIADKKVADAVVIATQDSDHLMPTIAFADAGYHILLEKPIAPTANQCRQITDCIAKSGVLFAVGHVLRYTPQTRAVKALLDTGVLGDIVNINRVEPVGYWHFAHSYVRGNWNRQDSSSFILLSKCCHDIDWIRYIMDEPCVAVSSFGNLSHFKIENKPPQAAERCMDCSVEKQCAYSAKKHYLSAAQRGYQGWPLTILAAEPDLESITLALNTGPYGRCVYQCDNDVPDHQVVNMEFRGGGTASFTMVGFSEMADRSTRISGTLGRLDIEGDKLRHYDFLTDQWHSIAVEGGDNSHAGGHGGGDAGLMSAFVQAIAEDDASYILTDHRETLESHLMTFEAERARIERKVIELGNG